MALALAIVGSLAFGVGLVVWLARGTHPSEVAQPSLKPAAPDPDSEVLFQLAIAGLDLSQPQEPGFFLYFPRRDAAHEAAREIEAAGFSTTVELGSGGEQWLCLAKTSMVLTRDALVAIRVAFSELAARHDGEYDGWGAEVAS
jgi:hypothetical protein